MAERLHQVRVIHLLEPFLEYRTAPVRSKASEWLLVATYRPPDGTIQQGGQASRWRG